MQVLDIKELTAKNKIKAKLTLQDGNSSMVCMLTAKAQAALDF